MVNDNPVTLLITNSIDYLADLLVAKLGTENVFRFNTDLWQQYKLCVSDTDIELEDPTGRKVTESRIAKIYRRSAMRASTVIPKTLTDAERYAEEEVWMAWSDLVNMFWMKGKVVLIQPSSTTRSGKLQQLRVAGKYFKVPNYRFLIDREDQLRAGTESVAKSFNFKFADGIGFYSQKVDEGDLDPEQPWFLTDYVDADEDVTVAVVRDELFAFSLDRTEFLSETIDWRRAPSQYAHKSWEPLDLPSGIAEGIFAFMSDMGVHYARIDFLKKGDSYSFLEANFAGEWGWLDPDGTRGLMNKILYEIDPRTPLVSCPHPQWVT